MKRSYKRKIKIWWRIPELNLIENSEAKNLIFNTMQIASQAMKIYQNIHEDPHYYRMLWLFCDANKGIYVYNYMVANVNDSRVVYHAELI